MNCRAWKDWDSNELERSGAKHTSLFHTAILIAEADDLPQIETNSMNQVVIGENKGVGGAEWKETLGEICNSESDAEDQFCEWYGSWSGKTIVGNEDETTDKRVIRVEENQVMVMRPEVDRPWVCLSFHAATPKAVEAEEIDLFVARKPILGSMMGQIDDVAKWRSAMVKGKGPNSFFVMSPETWLQNAFALLCALVDLVVVCVGVS
ncbi:hypothetical protein M436DRAFT_68217 [Aureobasidium namibiae CBS 147.97]|uniref:Uncharacterized protein n=1 Tax=Aureobasidium namibiae CBS 147.97 TaxID=1043004 RepID=A0A074WEN6_9PEZI|nr:uncharacterized protein M436DRAFT_68217 [Aureobasidium namibiae CBS 147.97]KEQ68352.1 hypothetical protein M436DRAFT_68217 [Aureobasidium namibiae CBS 147.97]